MSEPVQVRVGYPYIRFSTPEQAHGDSYQRQLEGMQRYAAKHNIELDHSLGLEDLGVSGFTGANVKTGKLGVFLEAVDSGRVKPGSVLLVEAIDRFSRTEPAKALNQLYALLEKGITVVEVTNNKEYTIQNISELGNSVETFLRMAINHERSQRTKGLIASARERGRARARSGIVMTKNVPGWLRVTNGKIVSIKERVALVKRMFKMSLAGIGIDAIAKRLNEEQVPTWTRSNGWYMPYVNTILRHRALLGEFSPKKYNVPQEPIPDYYPKVIDEALFYAVQAALTARRSKGGVVGDYVNLFSHLVKCSHCDSSIVRWNRGWRNGRRAALVCNNGRRGVNDCGVKPWLIDDFEQKILKYVKEVNLAQILGSEQAERVAALQLQLQGHHAQLADTEDRLNSLVLALEKGANVPRVIARIKQLETELETLTAACVITKKEHETARLTMESAESKQRDVVELMAVVHDRDVRLKLREQLRGLIERIDVNLVQKSMVIFYVGQSPRAHWISPDVAPKTTWKTRQSSGTG